MSERSYTVYEPHVFKTDLLARSDELIFVKDGFSFSAMFFSVMWMVYHRLWLPLIGFVIALGILQLLAKLFGATPDATGLLFVGMSLAFGFLANDIRRLSLEHDNYKLVGAIHGSSQLDCENRFFSCWAPLLNEQEKEAAL